MFADGVRMSVFSQQFLFSNKKFNDFFSLFLARNFIMSYFY